MNNKSNNNNNNNNNAQFLSINIYNIISGEIFFIIWWKNKEIQVSEYEVRSD